MEYLEILQVTELIKKSINKQNKKEVLKQFYNEEYLEYIERIFKDIYDIYLRLKNNKEIDWNQLSSLLEILINYLKFKLLEINKNLYDGIKV